MFSNQIQKFLKNFIIIAFIAISISIINSCKPEDEDKVGDIKPKDGTVFEIPEETLGNSIVEGIVTNQEGIATVGATVHFGQSAVQTNGNGYFKLSKVSDGASKHIYFTEDGYMMTQKLTDVTNKYNARIDATLYLIERTQEIGSNGATINYNDFEIIVPEGAFPDGSELRASAHRPEDEHFLNSFPGRFEGRRTDNSTTPVESYGFLNVEIIKDGKLIQPTKPVTLKIKAPSYGESEVPMWYYDFVKGEWLEEGVAKLKDGYYEGIVNHFTPWNVDIPFQPSFIKGRVVDQFGNVLEGALVEVRGVERATYSSAITKEDGKFIFQTRENGQTEITAYWNFFTPTNFKNERAPRMGETKDIGDIVIIISEETEENPIIENGPLDVYPGETTTIEGKFFGNEFKQNYTVLVDDQPVEKILTWSNTEIRFVGPAWSGSAGKVRVLRGTRKSNDVDYEKAELIITTFKNSNSKLPNFDLPYMVFDKKDVLWIATWGGGLVKYESDIFTIYDTNNSNICSNQLHDVIVDNDGNIIVGSWDNGISIFNGNNFTNFNESNSSLSNNRINAMTKDKSGIIWIATDLGISSFDGTIFTNINTSNSNLPGNKVSDVIVDQNDKIWIGTWGGGFASYNGTNFDVTNMSNSLLTNNQIKSMMSGKDGIIWVGTEDGNLHEYKNGLIKTYNKSNSLFTGFPIYGMYFNSEKEDLWMGTWGGGVFKFNNGSFKNWTTASGLPHNKVDAIAINSKGEVWLGTDGGLVKMKFLED